MDGRGVAQEIRERAKLEIDVLKGFGVKPSLANILVGDSPASRAYLKNRDSACREAGIHSRNIGLDADTSQAELHRVIQDLNHDQDVTGILLQLPLPKGLDDVTAIMELAPQKDVDGLHPFNVGQLWRKSAPLVPCTPRGVVVLLKHYRVDMAGKHVVIVNRTKVVGRPLAQLLLNEDATVTICHSKTQRLRELTKEADILVTGIGRREQITVSSEMIKPGAAVVDVGTSEVNGQLVGDVDFDSALKTASFLTPVPGGVGPMTTALLLYNTLLSAAMQKGVQLRFAPEGVVGN